MTDGAVVRDTQIIEDLVNALMVLPSIPGFSFDEGQVVDFMQEFIFAWQEEKAG